MAPLPFTSAGVAQKVQEFYAMEDKDLLTAVRPLTADFGTWLNNNFILGSQQLAWLTTAPGLEKFSWGALIGSVLSARGEIHMEDPPDITARRTKEIIIDINGDITYYPPVSGSGTGAGSLQLNITWRLVD